VLGVGEVLRMLRGNTTKLVIYQMASSIDGRGGETQGGLQFWKKHTGLSSLAPLHRVTCQARNKLLSAISFRQIDGGKSLTRTIGGKKSGGDEAEQKNTRRRFDSAIPRGSRGGNEKGKRVNFRCPPFREVEGPWRCRGDGGALDDYQSLKCRTPRMQS